MPRYEKGVVSFRVSSESESTEATAKAGRGGLAVLAAKVFFILVGFIQQPLLKGVMGLAGYGALSGRVLPISNILNNVIVSGSTQSVSRLVAQNPRHQHAALRHALRIHTPIAGAVAIGFIVFAPIYTRFQGAPHILLPLLVMSGVALLYGLYAPLIGYLNGRGQFVRQASLDVLFATLRTVLLVGGSYLLGKLFGLGVLGACLGFVGAAALILPIALRWTGTGSSDPNASLPPARAYLTQWFMISGAQLAMNALMQSDISILGHCLSKQASQGAWLADPSKASDEWLGVYRACQLFAFLPYQLLFSVTQVLFPMLARAHSDGDHERVRALVLRGSRIALLLCGLLVSIVVTLPGSLLHFAYGSDVAERGATTLRLLASGMSAFALLALALTILTSLGRERWSLAITFGSSAVVAVVMLVVVRNAPFGEPQLLRTALTMAAVLAAAFVVATVSVHRRASVFFPISTFLRVFVVVVTLALAGRALPILSRVLTPVAAALVALFYFAMLALTRELSRFDLDLVRSVFKRRAS